MNQPHEDPNPAATEQDDLSLQPLEHSNRSGSPGRRNLRKELKATIQKLPGKNSPRPISSVGLQKIPTAEPVKKPSQAGIPTVQTVQKTAPSNPKIQLPGARPSQAGIPVVRPSQAGIPAVHAAPTKHPSNPVIIPPSAPGPRPSGRLMAGGVPEPRSSGRHLPPDSESGVLDNPVEAVSAEEAAQAAPYVQPFTDNASDETQVRIKPPSQRPGSVRHGSARGAGGSHAAGSRRAAEPKEDWMPYAIGGGVLMLGLFAYLVYGGKASYTPETSVAKAPVHEEKINTEPPVKNAPASTEKAEAKADKKDNDVGTEKTNAKDPKTPQEVKDGKAAPAEKSDAPIELATGAKEDAPKTETAVSAPPAEASKNADEVAGVKPAMPKLKSGEDEDIVEEGPKKARKTPATDAPAGLAAATGTKKDEEMGGEKKIGGILGGLIEKKDDPANPAKPNAPSGPAKRPLFSNATGKEPSVINDASRLQGIEKDTCLQLQNSAPGWWARDFASDNTNLGMSHRGRDKVLKLNPPNDVLCSKVVGTLDLPAGFNSVLRFEVASTDEKKTWNLIVRVAGQEILPKQAIRTKSPNDWQEIIVPLGGGLAGKQFDIQIEGWSPSKDSKTFKDQIMYVRNMRLDWQGKK